MRPDATRHRPEPAYLRALAEQSGMSLRELSRVSGIQWTRLRRILSGEQPARYPEQYVLERLSR